MKWFKRSTAGEEGEQGPSPLKREIDVVPKTEFTASRQALNNINIALSPGDASGEASGRQCAKDNKRSCLNQHCCGLKKAESHDELADYGDGESIKRYKYSKSRLIQNLQRTDNNARASEGSIFIETKCRRPSNAIKSKRNHDCIIYFDPCVDYGRIECPDSLYPSLIDYPMVRYGKYVQLKGKTQRHMSQCHDLFTTSDKLDPAEHDKSSINYQLLSNVEKQLDEANYNLLNCRIYNSEFKKTRERLDREFEDWKLEDFNDDKKSTRMSEDTKAIREFYKLSFENNVQIHFQGITVETADTTECYSKSCKNFLAWLVLKGKEMTEEHKTKETSWIKIIMNFFKATKSKLEKNYRQRIKFL